jgi:hypothetical protein
MTNQIVIQPSEGIQKQFLAKIQLWANEVLEKIGPSAVPPFICINIWRRMDELESFYQKEKRELGIAIVEDTEFLASHEAWRGDPRIHICQERVKNVPDIVIRSVIHHEISHALLHGAPEFYTFRYSTKLQDAGRICGLDLALLQQCVYLLSIAIKDDDVVTWLTDIGLGVDQLHLLEYMITDTQDERRIWEVICANPVPRKLALAFFLKTLLPIEALVLLGVEGAETIKDKWQEAYDWLSETVKEGLVGFTHNTMANRDKPFQKRIEDVAINFISDASL